ncbi:hypothetical protein KBJ94_29240 [Pseudomonas sp. ITA]|uniref:hypothetical protein n=1 Tax=Pseudomonas sp. ITA TaxID=2825841 RepID=UPI0024992871|nr:hypothetical protein [Pseudomonas sp. ITA]MDI2146135.1 hypothetical protein [Pseudomonas sp. ITA]
MARPLANSLDKGVTILFGVGRKVIVSDDLDELSELHHKLLEVASGSAIGIQCPLNNAPVTLG